MSEPPILCQEKINENLLLTDRQKDVVGLLALGMSRLEIAKRLFLSVKTVDQHIYRIYKILRIKGRDNRTTLILTAFKRGWVKARPDPFPDHILSTSCDESEEGLWPIET